MNEQEFDSTPSGHESTPGTPTGDPAWGAAQPNYSQAQYPPPPPGYVPPAEAASGLSDTAASALAYLTFIPAVVFLLVPPYNQKPLIRFHAIQELGLSVAMFILSCFLIIPILGWLIYFVGMIGLLVLWVLCILKASQGKVYKLPVVGNFAAQQSGYTI